MLNHQISKTDFRTDFTNFHVQKVCKILEEKLVAIVVKSEGLGYVRLYVLGQRHVVEEKKNLLRVRYCTRYQKDKAMYNWSPCTKYLSDELV